MKITIFGAGYVGLVTGVCFAEIGHQVKVVDIDSDRVSQLKEARSPIYEPGLGKLLAANIAANRIDFTTDIVEAVIFGEVQFIAVGTPADEDGSADLQYVLAVAQSIGQYMTTDKVIVTKSTVPVGTSAKVWQVMQQALADRPEARSLRFFVASNPEFLKEGAAIKDFMYPDRVVIGTDSEEAETCLRELYQPLLKSDLAQKLVLVDITSAELIKYAANAMLATKISFVNELSRLAEKVGADIKSVCYGMGLDQRIGPHFINPGCGYGGSCFPKDVQALISTADAHGEPLRLLQAVEEVNREQKIRLGRKIHQHFKGDLGGKVFALWGLAFKPNTDDIREASSLVVVEYLLSAGAKVRCYDPQAMTAFAKLYQNFSEQLVFCDDLESTLEGAAALVVVTEWLEFLQMQPLDFANRLSARVIFDGRNIFNAKECSDADLIYYGIGVGEPLQTVVPELIKECV